MRDIDVKEVTRAVAECCIDSCNNLPEGVLKKLEAARKEEISPLGCQVLDTIIENAKLANKKHGPDRCLHRYRTGSPFYRRRPVGSNPCRRGQRLHRRLSAQIFRR